MKEYYDTIPMGGGGESPVEAAAKELDSYDLERLYEWVIDDKRKPAITAFTSGIARNIASHIELLLWQKSNPGEQGQEERTFTREDMINLLRYRDKTVPFGFKSTGENQGLSYAELVDKFINQKI